MGAFDGELYALGYRFPQPTSKSKPVTQQAHINALHVARMPCPGNCGSVCPNHYCPAHNGTAYTPKELQS